jgi:cysteine desulfurase
MLLFLHQSRLFVNYLTYNKESSLRPVYLDCNATTPLEPEVKDLLWHYLTEEYGNEGSRTHQYGAKAKQAVQHARDQVAAIVDARRDEVIFTSGATESNNLAILGLQAFGCETSKRHLITTRIEHKAILEPMQLLEKNGFEVTYIPVGPSGMVEPELISQTLRPDTLLVSVMQVNNETGIRQPIDDICKILANHSAFFHTDAAQGFGKDLFSLKNPRIDLISISGHKIFAPKGVGALITRRRGYERIPLKPITVGGGQERGLRPGTLPVALIAALGLASEIAARDINKRNEANNRIKSDALAAFYSLNPRVTGDQAFAMPHVLNLAFPGLDSEALIVALKDEIAISNGSACTSSAYKASHVLTSMGMPEDEANACVRISWCHLTPQVNWISIAEHIAKLI